LISNPSVAVDAFSLFLPFGDFLWSGSFTSQH
jgi:hypothetical protein